MTANTTRVTIYHGRYRADAEERRKIAEHDHPDTNPKVTGEQGNWKVRRDLEPGEVAEDVRFRGFSGG